MTAPARIRPVEPSHTAIIEVIKTEVGHIGRRLDHGEARFDRIESKLDHQGEDIAEVKTAQAALTARLDSVQSLPWWQQIAPVAAVVVLALFAGLGLGLVALTQLDLLAPILEAAATAHELKGASQ